MNWNSFRIKLLTRTLKGWDIWGLNQNQPLNKGTKRTAYIPKGEALIYNIGEDNEYADGQVIKLDSI